MKRTLLISILFISFLLTFGQRSWVGFTSDSPRQPSINVLEQNSDKVILDISISGMYTSTFEKEGSLYNRLELMEDQTTQDVGYPELPVIVQVIGIPDHRQARVTILSLEKTSLQNYLIFPFQTPEKDIKGGQSVEFAMNQGFYAGDKAYPSSNVFMDSPGIWRDVKIEGLHIIPFTYNPSKKELEVITHLKVEVEFYGVDNEHLTSGKKELTPSFYRMYDAVIGNFKSLGYSMTYRDNPGIKYLIITNTAALGTLQPFIDWKNQQGFKVEVKTLETGFNQPQDFKTYITQLYQSDGLEYVLMVGDAYPNGGTGGGPNIVPMFYWAPAGEDASFSDTWYVCLDGPDDHYADLSIGRFVYNNTDELALQIQKTMGHYLNPDVSTNWAENTLLVAHMEEYPGKYTQCKEEIRTFNYALQTPIFTPCYGGAGASNTDIISYINNNSCGIFNYRGHGSETEFWEWCSQGSFTNTHIQQLTNQNRLFVLFDVDCDNMDIVNYAGDCLCESFMKSPVASVATNGAIIPSYTIPNHDYDKEMYKAVFQEGIYNIGYVTNFANITVLNVHGDLGRSNVRTFLWLGDASLEPWTLQPATLTVAHDPQLFLGLTEYSVSVNGTMGPVENAMVCVTNDDGSIYGVAYTDAAGLATVTFNESVQVPGFAKVTVTAHNYLPYQSEIPVIPLEGAYVVKDSYTINDASGNGNGVVDYGESVLLSLTVKNVGLEDATDVTVDLNTTDEFITMTNNSAFYGNIPAESTVSVEDAFGFDVSTSVPNGHNVLFEVTATDGTNNWVSNFSLPVHAPVLILGNVSISDPLGNNNGKIDPGETANISITINNTGSSESFDVAGLLQTSDPYVTIENETMNYGSIAGGGSGQQTYTVTADADTPAGHRADFTFDITAFGGITATGTFSVVVGQVPVGIIDLDPNHSSGTVMQQALEAVDVGSDYLTSVPDNPDIYSSLFVCLGIYSSNHVLTAAEGQTLADYLQKGGMIYMEGGDTWYYDPKTAVHPMFNITGVADGASDLGTINGMAGTFTEGMSFTYSGENGYIDHLSPVGNAFSIFENQSPQYFNGVANDAGSYKTIGASFEFGGLNDGPSRSTKEDLMKEYLDFFGLMPPEILANFTASETHICPEEGVQFTDLSVGSVISWEWEFPGGDPSGSNDQNPFVTYITPGSYDVTLTVSNGTSSHSITRPGYIHVNDLPAATLSGNGIICSGDSTQLTIDLTGQAPWTIVMGEGEMITANEWPYIFWVSPVESTDYTIATVTDATGCSNAGDGMATVTVNNLPGASLTGTSTICEGDSAQLTVELTGLAPWTIEVDNNESYMANESPCLFWVKPLVTTGYSITNVTDGNGCSAYGTGLATITVNTLPEATLSGDTEICAGDSAQITVQLNGLAPWSVELSDDAGGTFFFDNIPLSPFQPWVHPVATSTYSITTVTDAVLCHNTGTGNSLITLKPLPATPSIPEGVDSVDVYKVTSSVFTTNGSEFATSYNWSLAPENAGSMLSAEMSATVTWNPDFTGAASIGANGMNDCGQGEFSVAKVVKVYNSVGFEDHPMDLGVKISPNPAKSSFILEVTTQVAEIISIRLVNSQGSAIFVMNNVPVQGTWRHSIDVKNVENGVYFLSVAYHGTRVIRKLVVLK
jgi:PKD repeat protein